jgi:hypothetical protein
MVATPCPAVADAVGESAGPDAFVGTVVGVEAAGVAVC